MKEKILVSIDQRLLEKLIGNAHKMEISISALIESVMKKYVKFGDRFNLQDYSSRPPGQSLDEYLKEIERDEINKAVSSKETKVLAAEFLGISFRSLRHRLKQFEIE